MADERLKKSDVAARNTRGSDERKSDERVLSDEDRVEMFRQQFFQSALPNLPKIDGWHTCWLTTSNPRDTIHQRMRLGYEPLKPEDVPGWEYTTLKTGEYAGFIGVNEMLAFKLPKSLYDKFMKEAHYNMPLQEEEKLTDIAEFLKNQASTSGSKVYMGEGLAELADKRLNNLDFD